MEQTEINKRQSFRIKPREYENAAGIIFRKKVIPAILIDYSLQGCSLSIEKPVDVPVGEVIRIAHCQGEFKGTVCRCGLNQHGQIELGIKYTQLLDELATNRSKSRIPFQWVVWIGVLVAATALAYCSGFKLPF
jgi:hypothetical protein